MLKTLTPPVTTSSPAVSPAGSRSWKRLFQTSRAELVPGTSKYWIRILLAPLCLVLVAGLHWYRVEFRDQSQWKGGGFAMFSTVDSPSARSLRCYLLTDEGEIPVELPIRLEKWASEMRVAPAAETLHLIAERVDEATWVRSGHQWRSAEREILSGDERSAPAGEGRRRPSVSALGIGEPLPPASEIVSIDGVRIELWRYAFDRDSASLVNRKTLAYTHRPSADDRKAMP